MSSSFITAMDEYSSRAVGVNGSDVYKEPVGESQELLALFGALNRDLPGEKLYVLLENAIRTASVEDLLVLAFHTRDILEGKGERELFYKMFLLFLHLVHLSKDTVLKLVKLIPDYGAWFDLQRLVEDDMDSTENNDMLQRIIDIYAEQLKLDDASTGKLSLAGKWAPREGKSDGWLAKRLARHMFGEQPTPYKLYRQLVSRVNANLDTVERKMCHDAQGHHHFADIQPGKVPSRCLKTKRNAFFDEGKNGEGACEVRHPDDPDRVKCRENFQQHMNNAIKEGEVKVKVHGKTLMPHEFIVELERAVHVHMTDDGHKTLQAQWNDLRDSILSKGTLGKTVVMSDFSGSMRSGGHGNVQPIHVSKGLGLLCAECTSQAFRDRILTFESKPTWHNVSRYNNLRDRINSFNNVSQGLSTNFQAAMNLVLSRLVEAKVPVGEEPDIILVITDMGWDEANKNKDGFETHIDRIKREFKTAGDWKVPTIVIWNVSGKFQEYHHKSDTEGVCVISGWSPAILKYIMTGENIVEKMKTMTPYKMMRQVLDDARYDPIREVFKVKTI